MSYLKSFMNIFRRFFFCIIFLIFYLVDLNKCIHVPVFSFVLLSVSRLGVDDDIRVLLVSGYIFFMLNSAEHKI